MSRRVAPFICISMKIKDGFLGFPRALVHTWPSRPTLTLPRATHWIRCGGVHACHVAPLRENDESPHTRPPPPSSQRAGQYVTTCLWGGRREGRPCITVFRFPWRIYSYHGQCDIMRTWKWEAMPTIGSQELEPGTPAHLSARPLPLRPPPMLTQLSAQGRALAHV